MSIKKLVLFALANTKNNITNAINDAQQQLYRTIRESEFMQEIMRQTEEEANAVHHRVIAEGQETMQQAEESCRLSEHLAMEEAFKGCEMAEAMAQEVTSIHSQTDWEVHNGEPIHRWEVPDLPFWVTEEQLANPGKYPNWATEVDWDGYLEYMESKMYEADCSCDRYDAAAHDFDSIEDDLSGGSLFGSCDSDFDLFNDDFDDDFVGFDSDFDRFENDLDRFENDLDRFDNDFDHFDSLDSDFDHFDNDFDDDSDDYYYDSFGSSCDSGFDSFGSCDSGFDSFGSHFDTHFDSGFGGGCGGFGGFGW